MPRSSGRSHAASKIAELARRTTARIISSAGENTGVGPVPGGSVGSLPVTDTPPPEIAPALRVDPQIVVSGVATGAGTATLSIPFTLPADAHVVYAQGAHASSATALRLATTNVTRSLLGVAGFASYIYNFTVDGPLAQNGPGTQMIPMLLKP